MSNPFVDAAALIPAPHVGQTHRAAYAWLVAAAARFPDASYVDDPVAAALAIEQPSIATASDRRVLDYLRSLGARA